jgi:hypothetical protein
VLLVRGPQSLPDYGPNLMLLVGIRSIRNGVAGMIVHRDLRDLIAAAAIVGITKSRVIRIELHNCISIGNGFVSVRDHPYIDVIGEKLLFFRY